MEAECRKIVWHQFGAAIEALERALDACPEEMWDQPEGKHRFWYIAYHTLFWLDYYLTAPFETYVPPEPFTLSELDPEGALPDRVYAKEELKTFLEYGRTKARVSILEMSDEAARQTYEFGRLSLSVAELLLYNMRHVQHHTGQLNQMLSKTVGSAPRWVLAAKD
jgi:hypothetical protein